MYSPTSRLLTILELLQSHRQLSGAELSRRLEVDLRTVRRYIATLQDMGIPVEGQRGPHGGYRLRRGYRLPPLMFNDSEAIALSLSLIAMRQFNFPVDVAAVEGALAKILRVMPHQPMQRVRSLQEALIFRFVQSPLQPLESDTLVQLSLAVSGRNSVQLRYQSWHGKETERRFDPYGIVVNDGYWYVSGYCHLRQDLRTLRLDRIVALQPQEEHFERPPDFQALPHVLESLATMPGATDIEILIKAPLEDVQRAFPEEMGILQETPQGVLLRRAANDMTWIAHFLLWFDLPIVVLQPPELRDTLQNLGQRALRFAQRNDDRPAAVAEAGL